MACESWIDHDWQTEGWLESGHDPARGRYQRFKIVCQSCKRTRTETRWDNEGRRLPFNDEPLKSGEEE